MNNDNVNISFQLILFAGNAKSSAVEAIQHAKKGNFNEADRKIAEAGMEFVKAHDIQSGLLQQEASGEKQEVNLLLVHAQDHLMTAMTVRDLAVELIEIYRMKF